MQWSRMAFGTQQKKTKRKKQKDARQWDDAVEIWLISVRMAHGAARHRRKQKWKSKFKKRTHRINRKLVTYLHLYPFQDHDKKTQMKLFHVWKAKWKNSKIDLLIWITLMTNMRWHSRLYVNHASLSLLFIYSIYVFSN